MDYKAYNEEKRNERTHYITRRRYSKIQYVLQFVLTLLVWLVSIYFFRDVFFESYNFIRYGLTSDSLPTDILYGLAFYSIIVFAIITIWIVYNKLMYGGRDRRKTPLPWNKQQVETLYHIDDKIYAAAHNNKILFVDFDEENNIKSLSNHM